MAQERSKQGYGSERRAAAAAGGGDNTARARRVGAAGGGAASRQPCEREAITEDEHRCRSLTGENREQARKGAERCRHVC
jgi:hypothetical protein